MEHIIDGTVHKFGDNINTDLISPAQYMELDNAAIIRHVMEGADPAFSQKVRPGDIIVAGKNFGSGSSRETAPIAIKGSGVSAVVAVFFARIFYRNCINIGLPALTCKAAEKIHDGDRIRIDFERGVIENQTKAETYSCDPLPRNILEIIAHGGLLQDMKYKREKGLD